MPRCHVSRPYLAADWAGLRNIEPIWQGDQLNNYVLGYYPPLQ